MTLKKSNAVYENQNNQRLTSGYKFKIITDKDKLIEKNDININ